MLDFIQRQTEWYHVKARALRHTRGQMFALKHGFNSMTELARSIRDSLKRKVKFRIDWEIKAHSETGTTYSVKQANIGTFKPSSYEK